MSGISTVSSLAEPRTLVDCARIRKGIFSVDRSQWNATAKRLRSLRAATAETTTLRMVSRAARASRSAPIDPLVDFEDAWYVADAVTAPHTDRSSAYIRAAMMQCDVDKSSSWRTETMFRLHSLLLDSAPHSGAFRIGQNFLKTRGKSLTDSDCFVIKPPTPDQIAPLLQQIFAFPRDSGEPGLRLLSEVASYFYFQEIHPFWDGNGRVARIVLARAVCLASESTIPLVPIEESFYAMEADYTRATDTARFEETAPESLHAIWATLLAAVNASIDRFERVGAGTAHFMRVINSRASRDSHLHRIGRIVITHERVSPTHVSLATGISTARVRAALRTMHECGLIERLRMYELNP